MIKREDVYRIGRIGKPHGVNGELNVMFDDDVLGKTDAEYLVIDVDGILVPFFIDDYRYKSASTALVAFEGIDSQQRAKELTGCDVFFPYADDDGHDDTLNVYGIIGFELLDAADGSVVGRIRALDNTTANMLFEVDGSDGRELLIPVGDELVEQVDVRNRQVVMRLPDGLLDLDKI